MEYLSAPKARNQVSSFFFLSDNSAKISPGKANINGAIHINSKITKNVMGSTIGGEIGTGCVNGQNYVLIGVILEEIRPLQPPMPIQVDNTITEIFANGTIKQKRSKLLDMNFHWLQDQIT